MTRWEGTFRLVTTPDLVDFIETAFVAPNPPAQRERARAEARHEAEGAELAISADGTIVSRSHGRELFRVVLPVRALQENQLTFDKDPSTRVTLRLVDADTLLALQTGKPPMTFRRS
jgi:hypothetical protein